MSQSVPIDKEMTSTNVRFYAIYIAWSSLLWWASFALNIVGKARKAIGKSKKGKRKKTGKELNLDMQCSTSIINL